MCQQPRVGRPVRVLEVLDERRAERLLQPLPEVVALSLARRLGRGRYAVPAAASGLARLREI